jgi:hypothetical protein
MNGVATARAIDAVMKEGFKHPVLLREGVSRHSADR